MCTYICICEDNCTGEHNAKRWRVDAILEKQHKFTRFLKSINMKTRFHWDIGKYFTPLCDRHLYKCTQTLHSNTHFVCSIICLLFVQQPMIHLFERRLENNFYIELYGDLAGSGLLFFLQLALINFNLMCITRAHFHNS